MKILCAYSSIEYQVQHIPSYLQGTGEVHPVFSIPQKKLFSLLPKWAGHELTDTDSYLLYLALFNSTGLVRWNTSARRTEHTASLIAQQMEKLAHVIGRINIIKSPRLALPQFVISSETRTLENTPYWIQMWENQIDEFLSGLKEEELRSKLSRREAGLEKLLKNPSIPPHKYSRLLAEWAAEAGEFPYSLTPNPLVPGQQQIRLDEYWKQIIQRCYSNDSIIAIPKADIQELIEHCEEHIEAGSIFSFHLFSTLREGLDRRDNYLGLGDDLNLSASNPGYRILDADTNIQDATLQLLVDTAPAEEPKKQNYPTLFAYLKAKLKWDTAQKYRQEPKPKDTSDGIGEL